VFVNGLTWLGPLQLICSFLLVAIYLKWLPHLYPWMNHVRIGAYSSIFYAALLLTILVYQPGLGSGATASDIKTFQ
jgi:uncharacterized membrane protein YphA (DoxX/SURF4 family)